MQDSIAKDHDRLHIQSLTYVLAIGGFVGCTDPLLENAVRVRPVIAFCCGIALWALIPVLRWTRNVRLVSQIGLTVITVGYFSCWLLSGDYAYLAQGLAIPVAAALFLRRSDATLILCGYSVAALSIAYCMSNGVWEPPYTPENFNRGDLGEALSVVLIAVALALPTIWKEHRTLQAITKEHTSRQETKEEQRRLEHVVKSSFGVVIETDEQGKIQSARGALVGKLGYEETELLGTKLADLFCDADCCKLLHVGGSVSEFAFDEETKILDADGEDHWVRLTITSFPDSQGQRRFVAAARDIEKEIETRERLNEVERLEGLSTLCAGLAHDFNNLLTVFGIHVCRVEDESLRKELNEAKDQAVNLTNGLLSFARRRPSSVELVEIRELKKSIEPVLKQIVGPEVECHWFVECPGTAVRAGASQLQQLLVNLATNAGHAMPNGGTFQVKIYELEVTKQTLQTHARRENLRNVDPGTYVVIEVSDTGVGMDEATVSRAIQPFYTTKPRGIGTGLGLSTTHGMVKSVGGTMWIDSLLGEGTTVTALLPKSSKFEVEATRKAAPSVRHHALQRDFVRPARIALVEDRQILAKSLMESLQITNLTTVGFGTGEQLLDSAEVDQFELIITDIELPGIDGVELTKELRRRNPELPVLLISAYSQNEQELVAESPEKTQFLAKPFSISQFYDAIDSLLGSSPANAAT